MCRLKKAALCFSGIGDLLLVGEPLAVPRPGSPASPVPHPQTTGCCSLKVDFGHIAVQVLLADRSGASRRSCRLSREKKDSALFDMRASPRTYSYRARVLDGLMIREWREKAQRGSKKFTLVRHEPRRWLHVGQQHLPRRVVGGNMGQRRNARTSPPRCTRATTGHLVVVLAFGFTSAWPPAPGAPAASPHVPGPPRLATHVGFVRFHDAVQP